MRLPRPQNETAERMEVDYGESVIDNTPLLSVAREGIKRDFLRQRAIFRRNIMF